jgi:hypothetical protein
MVEWKTGLDGEAEWAVQPWRCWNPYDYCGKFGQGNCDEICKRFGIQTPEHPYPLACLREITRSEVQMKLYLVDTIEKSLYVATPSIRALEEVLGEKYIISRITLLADEKKLFILGGRSGNE